MVTSDIELPSMIKSFGYIRNQINMLTPHQINFNRLSVEGVTKLHRTDEINATLDVVLKQIAEYGNWKESSIKLADDPEQGYNVVKMMTSMYLSLEKYSQLRYLDSGEDPRRLLHLSCIDDELIKKFVSIWAVIDANGLKNDETIKPHINVIANLLDNVVVVLNKVSRIFGINIVIPAFDFFGYLVGSGQDQMKFTLHDEVVAFSEDELAEQQRLERIAEEQRQREETLKARVATVKQNGEIILKSYNELKSQNVIEKVSFTDECVDALTSCDTEEKCELIEALSEFLIIMSNTERCMPGEDLPFEQRVKGSLMDLDIRVLTDKQMFMLYGARNNVVYNALKCFDEKNGKIVAQHMTSKEYIDSLIENENVISDTINVFVMS